MANMTFGVNLIPHNNAPTGNNTYTLGNSDYKWNLYVNQINGQTYNPSGGGVLYGECDTAASTAAKTASITNFALDTGAAVNIKFTYANTAASPTLSINSGTAKAITLNNGNVSPWDAGEIVFLVYDGTSWNIVDYDKVEVVEI